MTPCFHAGGEGRSRRRRARSVADRGYFSSEQRVLIETLLHGHQHVLMLPARDAALRAGRTAMLEAQCDEDVYRCPAGETLRYHYTNEENGLKLRDECVPLR